VSMLREYQDDLCYLCGHKMAAQSDILAPDVEMQSIDHVVPKSRGGTNRLGNVALAHKGCNNYKADRPPTACEMFFAESMAKAFEDSHVTECYQDFRLHVRGKGFMYVRPKTASEKPFVISRAYYRSLLKRKARESIRTGS
jgi:HNH endonuclease